MRHRARRDVVPAWLPRSRSYSEGVRAGIESYRKHRRVMSPPSGEPSFVRGFLDGEAHARSRHDPTKKQKRVSPHPGANPRTLGEFTEEVHALLLVKGLTESQARRLLRRWGRTVKYAWESGRPPCWTSDHLMKYDLRPDLSPRRKSSRDPDDHPASPKSRWEDLQKQGFMKPRKQKAPKKERPIVACEDCLNWHREGQHTADRATRAKNRKERVARKSSRDPGLEYTGEPMPKWVREGARVKVKALPHIRRFGLGFGNERFWPGDVGVIEREEGNGWWRWIVRFQGVHQGRGFLVLRVATLQDLVRL